MSSVTSRLAWFAHNGPWRPYAMALFWMLVAEALAVLGDRFLLQYGFPWALVSLLVVAGVANIYGTKPAILVLILSALFGDLLVPDLHISYFYGQRQMWNIALIRVLLYGACGIIMILLAQQARVMREHAERRREVVQALQGMMLPDKLIGPPGYDVAGLYKPARTEEDVGGDFYDLFPIETDKNLWGILIGDVMGKGKEAAVHTALLRYTIRAYAHTMRSPGHVLEEITALVESQRLPLQTASIFFGVLEANTGALSYANAGHEPPLLARACKPAESLEATGPLVGALSIASYETRCAQLDRDDSLLLFTDGVTEARDASGEFLDEAGAERLFAKALPFGKASSVLETIERGIAHFSQGDQRDDIALLLLHRSRAPRRLP